MLNRLVSRHITFEFCKIEAERACLAHKSRMQGDETNILHDSADDSYSIERLDPRGTIGNDADGSGGSDRSYSGVTTPLAPSAEPTGAIGWKGPTCVGEASRSLVCAGLNKLHQ